MAIGERVLGRLPTPGALHKQWIEVHPPNLSVKEASVCSGALARGIGFRYGIHLVDYRATPKERRLGMPF